MHATRARYGVLIFALAITAISYLDRVCISMTAPFIEKDLHLSDLQMGLVFSVFTFAYALFEIPGGWLADRFGPRLMMTRVVVWWSLLTAATGLAWGFVSLLLLRLLFGFGEARHVSWTLACLLKMVPSELARQRLRHNHYVRAPRRRCDTMVDCGTPCGSLALADHLFRLCTRRCRLGSSMVLVVSR